MLRGAGSVTGEEALGPTLSVSGNLLGLVKRSTPENPRGETGRTTAAAR